MLQILISASAIIMNDGLKIEKGIKASELSFSVHKSNAIFLVMALSSNLSFNSVPLVYLYFLSFKIVNF